MYVYLKYQVEEIKDNLHYKVTKILLQKWIIKFE